MPENRIPSDEAIWKELKEKFDSRSFRFRDVAALNGPERAYEFMLRAEEDGWIQSDEDGETYELNPDVVPESTTPTRRSPPSGGFPTKEFDEWYRGTKYHLGARGSISWVSPRKKLKVKVVSGFEGVSDKLRTAFPQGGTFRVDELGRVLVKDPEHDYQVVVVGGVRKIELDAIERDPRERVKPGYIWPSIYDGARYHFSDGRIWFRSPDGTRRYARSGHESLLEPLRKFKPQGGGFRITENGRVLTLRYTFPVPEEARAQWENLTDRDREVIRARESPGEDLLIPVFVADFRGKIELGPALNIHRQWSQEERDEFFEMLASRTGGDL